MPRPKRCRRIGAYPDFWSFAPEDAEEETEESVILQLDELETIRQIDYGRQTQEECAAAMGVSRATVTSKTAAKIFLIIAARPARSSI